MFLSVAWYPELLQPLTECEIYILWRMSQEIGREIQPEFYEMSQLLDFFLPVNFLLFGTMNLFTAEALTWMSGENSIFC